MFLFFVYGCLLYFVVVVSEKGEVVVVMYVDIVKYLEYFFRGKIFEMGFV